jgi:hypothetical protein
MRTAPEFIRLVVGWRPTSSCFSVNYLANVPEVIDLARARALLPETFIKVGGHSVSFILVEMATCRGRECVLTGEGETRSPVCSMLSLTVRRTENVPGCVTLDRGLPPAFVQSLDDLSPARLVQHRQKYFTAS